ncbi:MAG: hypothetical protein WA766_20620, partial [Candidatus Acidiferrales bacterium]
SEMNREAQITDLIDTLIRNLPTHEPLIGAANSLYDSSNNPSFIGALTQNVERYRVSEDKYQLRCDSDPDADTVFLIDPRAWEPTKVKNRNQAKVRQGRQGSFSIPNQHHELVRLFQHLAGTTKALGYGQLTCLQTLCPWAMWRHAEKGILHEGICGGGFRLEVVQHPVTPDRSVIAGGYDFQRSLEMWTLVCPFLIYRFTQVPRGYDYQVSVAKRIATYNSSPTQSFRLTPGRSPKNGIFPIAVGGNHFGRPLV